MNLFIKKFKKLACNIILSTLLLGTGSAYALTYKLTMETKKLPNGITHCIWNIHLMHEAGAHELFEENTPNKIAKSDKQAIIDFAKKVNAYVLIESMDKYNNSNTRIGNITDFFYEAILEGNKTFSYFTKKQDDTLSETYELLKKQDIDVENIEQRQDATAAENHLKAIPSQLKRLIRVYLFNKMFDFSVAINNNTAKAVINLATYTYPKYLFINFIFTVVLTALFFIEHTRKKSSIEEKAKKKNTEKLMEKLENEDQDTEETYAHLNDIETIHRIIDKEKELLQLTPKEQKLSHTVIVTGGGHSRRLREALLDNFEYEKTYVAKIPKFTFCIDSIEDSCIDTILHLPTCFEKGLKKVNTVTSEN